MVCSSAAPGYERNCPQIKKRSPTPFGVEPLLCLALVGYLDPRPNSVEDGSSAFSTGPATAARAAKPIVLISVSPDSHSAMADAIPARRYVAPIALSFLISISSPLDLLVLSS